MPKPDEDEPEDLEEEEDEEGDDDGDEDEDDEEEEAPEPEPPPTPKTVKTNAPAVRARARGRSRKPSTPPPARSSEQGSDLPPDAFTKPRKGEWARIKRFRLGAPPELCRLYLPDHGQWLERFGPPITREQVLELWGSGRYSIQWFNAQGQVAATPAPVELDKPGYPSKPCDARAPEAPPPPAPAPPPQPAPAPVAPERPVLPPMPSGLPSDVATWIQWTEYHEARAERKFEHQLARERADHQASVERLRAETDRAIAAEEARHRRALDEQESRARRDREHVTSLAKDLIESSRAAQEIAPLVERVEELEEEREQGAGAGQMIMQVLPGLVGTIGEYLANRGTATKPQPPIEGAPKGTASSS